MSVRKRWLYTLGGEPLETPIEVGDDYTGAERRAPVCTEEIAYGKGGVIAAGKHIDSRRKMKEYFKESGATHASDYSPQHFEKLQAERAKAFQPGSGYDSARRKATIVESMKRLEYQKRRKP